MTDLKSAILNYLKLNDSVHRKNLLAYLRNVGFKTSDRYMRRAIVSLIEDYGYLIRSGSMGYKLSESIADYEKTIKNLTSYAMKILKRRRATKRNFQRHIKPQLYE